MVFPISYLFPHIFSQEKTHLFSQFFSDSLKATLPSPENSVFSPCIHTAGESKKSNEYQERRSTKSPPCRLPPAQPALQTAESLCRSCTRRAQLEKRAQHCARDRLCCLPRAAPPHLSQGEQSTPCATCWTPPRAHTGPPGQQEGHTAHFCPLSSFPIGL